MVATPLAWSITVTPYWPMLTSVLKYDGATSAPDLILVRSIRFGSGSPFTEAHIERMPAARAKSTTLAAPTRSPTAKYTVFIDWDSAYVSWHPSGQLPPELRIGPAGLLAVRPLSLNSRVGGPSQYESIEMPD